MQLQTNRDFLIVHEINEENVELLLSEALKNNYIGAALGTLYEVDPAANIISAFENSAKQTGYKIASIPEDVLKRVKTIRSNVANISTLDSSILNEWTRSGLILSLCKTNINGFGFVKNRWRLKGTSTGRFGCESVNIFSVFRSGLDPVVCFDINDWKYFSPLAIPKNKRKYIIPFSSKDKLAVIDFSSFDLFSMMSIVPGLKERYESFGGPLHQIENLYTLTSELVFGNSSKKDFMKTDLFTYVYGGNSRFADVFEKRIPELAKFRSDNAGKIVQQVSATAFRAALSNALPHIVSNGINPVFTVHDELVLNYSEYSENKLNDIKLAMEKGASQRIGVPYRTKIKINGNSYEEVK